MNKINLYGIPGAGLSTFGAFLFAELRKKKLDVDIFHPKLEFFSMAPKPISLSQKAIFLKMCLEEENIRAQQNKLLITESHLSLSLIRSSKEEQSVILKIIEESKFPGREFHLFVNHPHANSQEKELKDFLHKRHIPFFCLDGDLEDKVTQALIFLAYTET